jgi:EAL domain-containing protein (putative c-di-GMP-specific phosphodiesterase class I)
VSEEELRGWFLETLSEGGKLRRVRISVLPFRVGRRQGLELVLPAESVSKLHAEIYGRGQELRLKDLGSRNGSFVNRVQVEDATLVEGDIVHFADFEFRVGRSDLSESKPESGPFGHSTTVAVKRPELPHRFVGGTRLLRDDQVTIVFQPIVLLARGTVAAYEALGRGLHPGLPEGPLELLRIAESIGREADLSRLFRRKAVELAVKRRDLPTVFLNTHPVELQRPGLLESLDELRHAAPQLDLALEIHERVLSRGPAIAELRGLLLERNIALAYDDFGAGQARLLELAEAPPHYLKFDQRFIAGLDQAPLAKRRLLQSLLTLARELLVKTVAEGIETPAEARVCAEIGFTHAQGFHMGKPRPLAEL